MAVGEFINITNYRQFENIQRDITEQMDLDPALVFQSALPGFLQRLFEDVGPWKDRQQKAFEFPSKLAGAASVAPAEEARMGGYDKKQIVAQPGWEIAGRTQTVSPSDFLHGGMTAAEVTRRVTRPLLDWNKTVFASALDVISAKGKSTGAPVDNGAYVINDFDANAVTKALVTNSADVCSDTIANSSQSVLWPLRDGTETAANHDHTTGAVGASWTLALSRTARDLVTEHPGMGGAVDVYLGKTNAEDIRSVLKSELGAIPDRQAIINLSIATAGGLGDAVLIADGLEGQRIYYCPDMDSEQALYIAQNKRPFFFSKGAKGVDGSAVGTGAWSDPGVAETRVKKFGYREHQSLGCQMPIACLIADFV